MSALETINLVLKGVGFLANVNHDIKMAKKHDADFMYLLGEIAKDASQSGLLSAMDRLESADDKDAAKQMQKEMQKLQLERARLEVEMMKKREADRILLPTSDGCQSGYGCG